MNNPMDCREKSKEPDWFDVKMLAAKAKLKVGAIRYHWRNAPPDLDLPPTAAGWLDAERAHRLLAHIKEAQEAEAVRRHELGARRNQQRYNNAPDNAIGFAKTSTL